MKIKVRDIVKPVIVQVTLSGYNRWLIKFKIAKCLIWLGCRISGMGVELKIQPH